MEEKKKFTIIEAKRSELGAVTSLRVRCDACGLVQRPLKGAGIAVPGQFSTLRGGGVELACGNRECEVDDTFGTEEIPGA